VLRRFNPKPCLECGVEFTPTAGPQVRDPSCQRAYALGSSIERVTAVAGWVRSLKIGKDCVDCGLKCTESNYPVFDWDHRPGVTKVFRISKGARHSRAAVLAEVAKCDLRCRNCHAIITHLRRKGNAAA